MPTLNNISCFIETPAGPLEEFPCIETNAPNTSTVYIPVPTDNSPFTINCKVLSHEQHLSSNALSFKTKIDGVKETGKVYTFGDKDLKISGTKVRTSSGAWELRKFLFSSIDFTEDHKVDTLALNKVNQLGEIVVKVFRYKVSGCRPRRASHGLRTSGGGSGVVVHEKSVKGRDISHSVGRAEGNPIKTPTTVEGSYLDAKNSPYMVFRFLYKSERALKNIGLLERSPSPPPCLNIERFPSLARVKGQEGENIKPEHRRLKRERADSSMPSSRAKAQRQMAMGDIETVDLTADD